MQGRGDFLLFLLQSLHPASFFRDRQHWVHGPAHADCYHSEPYHVPPNRHPNDLRIKSRNRRSWD